jgi:hypothetical protein
LAKGGVNRFFQFRRCRQIDLASNTQNNAPRTATQPDNPRRPKTIDITARASPSTAL